MDYYMFHRTAARRRTRQTTTPVRTVHEQPGPAPIHPKVVSLASRGIQPRFSDLVQACRKLVMNRLAEHLNGVFGQVDDTLFECAEKAENNKVQTLFFDSMREIRRQRPQIERSYHQQIATNFSDFLDGKLQSQTAAQLDSEHLELVQNEDYEETLQVTNMVSRVKARCTQQLFALEQRLALLNNGQKLGEDNNPFGPQAIAQAFREALAPCPFPLQIKTILYMLFDRHVMQSLDSLYGALNQRLIDAGVLPNLKYSAQINPSVSRPDAPKAEAPAPAQPATGKPGTAPASAEPALLDLDLSAPPPSDPSALFSGLSSLLDEHRHSHPDAPCSAVRAASSASRRVRPAGPTAPASCSPRSTACNSSRRTNWPSGYRSRRRSRA